MALTKLAIVRPDQTRFTGVGEESEISVDQVSHRLVFMGTNWAYVVGHAPKVKATKSQGGTTSSKLLVHHLAGSGSNPSRTRYLLVETDEKGFVAQLDGADETTLKAGEFIDVTNSEPALIGEPQEYIPSQHSETATALDAAETAEAELPEP